jgi:protein ImuB
MAFASIYVPNFWVQAVVRAESALRGRALALIDGTPPIWHVVAANEAALHAGIKLGMAKAQAEQFSGIEIRQRSRAQEQSSHTALLDLGWSISPRIEATAPDTVTLDLAGLHSLFGSEAEIARQLTQRATGLGLNINVAAAANLDAAIHAARGFPGITVIPPGEEAQRLGSLPVDVLFPTPEMIETFERWGVRTCAALAALPVLDLSERLGQEGVRLHEFARGVRERALVLAEPTVHFVEEFELEDSVEDLESLAFLLGRLLDQLCARLAARSLAASAIRYQFTLETNPSSTFEKVLSLPVPIRNSKTLLKLLRLQLQAGPPQAPILKITMAADPSAPRVARGGLFVPAGPDPEKLELTIARLSNLVGEGNVGAPELMDTHRPGEFRVRRFLPFRVEMKPPKKAVTGAGFRVYRPAPRASVTLRDGRPARVSFRGLRGNVTVASGPWRTSGDWWRENPWQQDEWDLEIQFEGVSPKRWEPAVRTTQSPPDLFTPRQNPPQSPNRGLYRFYFDALLQAWFVRGAYD